MERIELPKGFYDAAGPANIDFAFRAGWFQPSRNSLLYTIFGISATSLFAAILSPVLRADGTADKAGSKYIITLFVLYGIIMLVIGIFASGVMSGRSGYYVGTPEGLIHYRKRRMRIIDWEQFCGEVKAGGTKKRGNISFRLRTGKIISGKGFDNRRFFNDVIYIHGVPDAQEIAKICRKRIKENHPGSLKNIQYDTRI